MYVVFHAGQQATSLPLLKSASPHSPPDRCGVGDDQLDPADGTGGNLVGGKEDADSGISQVVGGVGTQLAGNGGEIYIAVAGVGIFQVLEFGDQFDRWCQCPIDILEFGIGYISQFLVRQNSLGKWLQFLTRYGAMSLLSRL